MRSDRSGRLTAASGCPATRAGVQGHLEPTGRPKSRRTHLCEPLDPLPASHSGDAALDSEPLAKRVVEFDPGSMLGCLQNISLGSTLIGLAKAGAQARVNLGRSINANVMIMK